ncbi:MAG: hypothetical protein ACLQL2_09620 [Methylovirgula sp.]
MNEFLARQAREISAMLERAAGRVIVNIVLAVLAIIAIFAGLAFLTVALYLKVATLAGTFYAALAVGGAFILLALIAILILRLRRIPAPRAPQPKPVEPEQAERRAALAANIDETVAPILSALHEANMQPAELALRVGAELSKQTGPFGLVALAVTAGFVLARGVSGKKD